MFIKSFEKFLLNIIDISTASQLRIIDWLGDLRIVHGPWLMRACCVLVTLYIFHLVRIHAHVSRVSVICMSCPLTLARNLLTPILKLSLVSWRYSGGLLLFVYHVIHIIQAGLLLKLSLHLAHSIPVLLAATRQCFSSVNTHDMTRDFLGTKII